jgi:hypothetical protein
MLYRKAFATPVLSINQTYHEGDTVGTLMQFDFRENKPNGYVHRLTIIDNNEEVKAALALFLFDGLPSVQANHQPFHPSAADMRLLIGTIAVESADYSHRYVNKAGHGLDFDLNDKYIYAYAVCRDTTPTFKAADDLTFKLGIYLNI